MQNTKFPYTLFFSEGGLFDPIHLGLKNLSISEVPSMNQTFLNKIGHSCTH